MRTFDPQRKPEHAAFMRKLINNFGAANYCENPLCRRAGERRHRAGPEYAAPDPATDPPAALLDRARDRHHDADDQAGFDHFAKDNEQRTEHICEFVSGRWGCKRGLADLPDASNRYLFDLEAFETGAACAASSSSGR